MVSNAIVPLDETRAIDDVKRLYNVVLALRNDVFIAGTDYGKIPGTGDDARPVLLLPGMEKLMRALRLRAAYNLLSSVEDFGIESDHAFFYYRYECYLIEIDTGLVVGSAIGSANSHETKWRWRDGKRKCPSCGKETINRSKPRASDNPNVEPGWYCWAKLGGCGATFAAKDLGIINQTVGRIENPDIADQLNTIDKIAQKRALASAIKTVANVSAFYTVDLEDMPGYQVTGGSADIVIPGDVIEGTAVEVQRESKAEPANVTGKGAGWSEKDSQDFIMKWRRGGHSDKEMLAALGIGNWGQWTGSLADANRRMTAFIAEQMNESIGAPASIA